MVMVTLLPFLICDRPGLKQIHVLRQLVLVFKQQQAFYRSIIDLINISVIANWTLKFVPQSNESHEK